jgi:signal transduction histidine kinase
MPTRQSYQIGLPKPVWIGNKLLLARRATVAGQVFLQGAWLDWDVISGMLLDEVRDLLPEARIEPVMQAVPCGPHDRMMAALPVRLVPGGLHLAGEGLPSPLRASLAVAWGCVAVALVALASLLAGALALGERRRTFVSAVTHELRTPLTTFRMYTEMLVSGMVTDEGKRHRYLETLRAEAGRLTHLVENVLAYARLEAGRPGGRSELIALGELMERIGERLGERARQGCMELAMELPDGERDTSTRLRLDPTAVEQILVNLVDNACKYGAAAGERAIRVEARRHDQIVVLRVSDHGPGVTPEDARKLFRPFSRSARDAAGNAPGVGLGLALSRRLARAMGGELKLDETYREGAAFVLTLPVR